MSDAPSPVPLPEVPSPEAPSPEARSSRTKYRFGLYELDTATAELRRDGRLLRLQEKPMAVLEVLLEHPGEIVNRETLRSRLWPDGVFVDHDSGINAAVRRLREVLGDSASNPRFIVTVPRRGYRFVAPVEVVAVDPPPPRTEQSGGLPLPPASAEPRPPHGLWGLGTLLVVALGLGALLPQLLAPFRSQTPPAKEPQALRLAVLPLAGHGTQPDRAFLADALTDELIVRLGRLQPRDLQVIARTSVQAYRETHDLRAVADELRVDYLLEGSLQQESDRLRIRLALVETEGQTQVWSRTFDREIGALLPLEKEIADLVAESLSLTLEVAQAADLPKGRAYELYLEGRYFLERLGEQDLRLALRAFERALEEDPSFAAAYASSAQAWVLFGTLDFESPRVSMPKARELAQKAARLDPDSAEATLVSAIVEHLYEWDFEAAAPLFGRALALDPGSPFAHVFAADLQSHQGNHERALDLANRALSLDPLSPTINAEVARLLFYARRIPEAIERCRRAIELDPSYLLGWDVLKWIHIHQGNEAEAIEAFLKVVELEDLHKEAVPELRELAARKGLRGLIEASVGAPDRRLAESGQSPFNLALDFATLGDIDTSLDWLEASFEAQETDLVSLGVDPRWDPLRGDERFQRLMTKVW